MQKCCPKRVNAWNSTRDLHFSMPRFVAMSLKCIILFYFPVWKSIQISAAGFAAIKIWKCVNRMTATSVSPVWTSLTDWVWRACRRWTTMRVSASSWLHFSIGIPSPTCLTLSSSVTYTFLSGNFCKTKIFARKLRVQIYYQNLEETSAIHRVPWLYLSHVV